MRIKFNADYCCGNARCAAKAPEVYDLDDMGHCLPKYDVVPEELLAAARKGADNCPESAIEITE